MIDITRPELLLAALKGKELACLFALQFASGPVKVNWLGEVTGLSEHSLTSALDKLLALGLAGHNGLRSDWQTAPGLRDVLLERVKGQPSLGECVADLTASEAESEPQGLPLESVMRVAAGQLQVNAQAGQALTGAFAKGEPECGWMVTDSIPGLPSAAMRGVDEPSTHGATSEDVDPPARATANRGVDEPNGSGAAGAEFDLQAIATANRGGDLPDRSPDAEVKAGGVKDLSPPASTWISSVGSERSAVQLARAILAASDLLFGEAVMGPAERYADLDLLLAHLADVYERRTSLRKPERVVYANIKQGFLPPEKYRSNPLDYLPRDFLEAAGLAAKTEVEADSGGIDPIDDPGGGARSINEEHISHSHNISQHGSLDLEVSAGMKRSASQAWAIALASLRRMLPFAVYSETVEGLSLCRFDQEGCCFYVAARDMDHAAWMEQHLRRTLERALTGACGLEARASFLVEATVEASRQWQMG